MRKHFVLPHWRPVEPHPWAAFLVGGFLCFLTFWGVAIIGLLAGGAR